MILASTPERAASQTSTSQFRIRDLMLAMLIASLILAGGRMAGGAVGSSEGVLLAVAMLSILLAAVFLRRRSVWYGFLVLSFLGAALLVPGGMLVRWSVAGVAAAHFFFAALPVLASGPLQHRWRWIAAAAGCQLAAAVFTPADPVQMIGIAAPLAWLLSLVAVIFNYRSIPRATPPEPQSRKSNR